MKTRILESIKYTMMFFAFIAACGTLAVSNLEFTVANPGDIIAKTVRLNLSTLLGSWITWIIWCVLIFIIAPVVGAMIGIVGDIPEILTRPPNIEAMSYAKDVKGLVKALRYQKGALIMKHPTYMDYHMRIRAAESLGNIGSVGAVRPLIDALSDSNADMRQAVAQALGEIGDACAAAPITLALSDDKAIVRAAAAEALGKIGHVAAVRDGDMVKPAIL